MDSDHYMFPTGDHDLQLSAADIEALETGLGSSSHENEQITSSTADLGGSDDVFGIGAVLGSGSGSNTPGIGVAAGLGLRPRHQLPNAPLDKDREGDNMAVDNDDPLDLDFTDSSAAQLQELHGTRDTGDVTETDSAQGQTGTRSRIPTRQPVLSAEERKRRTRDSNRRAAEKSRAKKRKDLNLTEQHVEQLRKDNEQLRVRLAELKGEAIPAPTNTESRKPPTLQDSDRRTALTSELDRAYVARLQSELLNAKITLLERHIELEKLRNGKEDDIEHKRAAVEAFCRLQVLKGEATAIKAATHNLGEETGELGQSKETVEEKLKEKRAAAGDAQSLARAVREAAGVQEGDQGSVDPIGDDANGEK